MEHQISSAFWVLSFVILTSAILLVSLKNVFHCALFMVLCLFSVAGIFILLDAEFLAAAQVLIYVGAVSILMIFAIMLTNNLTNRVIKQTNENGLVSLFVCLSFAVGAIMLISKTHSWNYRANELGHDNSLILGKYLMTEFMLPFEVISVLLLAAMIGAIALARKERS